MISIFVVIFPIDLFLGKIYNKQIIYPTHRPKRPHVATLRIPERNSQAGKERLMSALWDANIY